MLKKIFIVSSVILAVLLIFWGIYNFAFKPAGDMNNGEGGKDQDAEADELARQAEEATAGKIKDISGEPVIAPVIDRNKRKIVFYAAKDGRVFSLDFDGNGRNVFSSEPLEGLEDVLWSSDLKRVISVFDGGTRKYMYDYESKKGSPLKSEIRSVSWSNLGDKLVYQYSNGKFNELDLSDPDGSNWKKITEIKAPQAKVAPVPQTSLVSFWNYPKAGEETGLLTVGILGGEVKRIASGRTGADYLWAPDGKKVLTSYGDETKAPKINLGIMNNDGSGFQDLAIPTFASKCAWSEDSKTVYYALPSGMENRVLPDEYDERKFFSKDTFWKVNIETGEKERLIELDDLNKLKTGFDASKLFLSSKEDVLFFVNRPDQHLYRLELKQD